jgi:hypothetical protein
VTNNNALTTCQLTFPQQENPELLKFLSLLTRVVDPDCFFMDPDLDPAFLLNPDPDPS